MCKLRGSNMKRLPQRLARWLELKYSLLPAPWGQVIRTTGKYRGKQTGFQEYGITMACADFLSVSLLFCGILHFHRFGEVTASISRGRGRRIELGKFLKVLSIPWCHPLEDCLQIPHMSPYFCENSVSSSSNQCLSAAQYTQHCARPWEPNEWKCIMGYIEKLLKIF